MSVYDSLFLFDGLNPGEIDEIIDGLITNDQTEKMKGF